MCFCDFNSLFSVFQWILHMRTVLFSCNIVLDSPPLTKHTENWAPKNVCKCKRALRLSSSPYSRFIFTLVYFCQIYIRSVTHSFSVGTNKIWANTCTVDTHTEVMWLCMHWHNIYARRRTCAIYILLHTHEHISEPTANVVHLQRWIKKIGEKSKVGSTQCLMWILFHT